MLGALAGLDVLVVDDGTPLPSPVADAARDAGARYLRMDVNSGPAAARNAGVAAAATSLVALVDSDCEPEPGWLDRLVPFFDDPRVAVVAPRVVARPGDRSLLARYERSSSALDMGSRPALVRPGARLGFLPSATMLVRRAAVVDVPFDADLRLGEDVDLVWRLADSGAHVRYEPSVTVVHELRGSWRVWALRRFQYGTSSATLEKRHSGRLAPLRLSLWNACALGLAAFGHPMAGIGVAGVASGLLARRLASEDISWDVATRVVAAGVFADGVAVGHALRREYWPLGAAALLATPWSRGARLAAGVMLAPVLAEWLRERPDLDPLRYTGIRLVSDAAYGSGVMAGCVQGRTIAPLRPRWRHTARRAARAGVATPST
jgi:mycofactocin system glycosyltransferase